MNVVEIFTTIGKSTFLDSAKKIGPYSATAGRGLMAIWVMPIELHFYQGLPQLSKLGRSFNSNAIPVECQNLSLWAADLTDQKFMNGTWQPVKYGKKELF